MPDLTEPCLPLSPACDFLPNREILWSRPLLGLGQLSLSRRLALTVLLSLRNQEKGHKAGALFLAERAAS